MRLDTVFVFAVFAVFTSLIGQHHTALRGRNRRRVRPSTKRIGALHPEFAQRGRLWSFRRDKTETLLGSGCRRDRWRGVSGSRQRRCGGSDRYRWYNSGLVGCCTVCVRSRGPPPSCWATSTYPSSSTRTSNLLLWSLESVHPNPTSVVHVHIDWHSTRLHGESARELPIHRIDHPHRRSHLRHHRHLVHHHLLQHQRIGWRHAHCVHVHATHPIWWEPTHHDVWVRRAIGDVVNTGLNVIPLEITSTAISRRSHTLQQTPRTTCAGPMSFTLHRPGACGKIHAPRLIRSVAVG